MNGKLARLAERREQLIAQAASQRAALAGEIETWRKPLALADQGLAALRFIRRNAVWFAGAAAVLAVARPKQTGKWLRRGWFAWQLFKKLQDR
jgi:hypothetical protein